MLVSQKSKKASMAFIHESSLVSICSCFHLDTFLKSEEENVSDFAASRKQVGRQESKAATASKGPSI